MAGLKEVLLSEKYRMEELIQKASARLKAAPEGTLRISKSHNNSQYYWCTPERKRGIYITKNNLELAKRLAQKEYDEKVLRLAQKRYLQLERLTKDYDDNEIENIYLREHTERKKYIKPIEPTWKQRIEEWRQREYEGKGFQEGASLILTDRGEQVRSKSEKILADYFFRNGIEYKYECPLYLKRTGTVYPDFTFLSKKTGQEIYWEHCGKADDPKYAKNMVRKINTYEDNGIFPGERLILTFETEQTILSTGKIEQLADRYLR